MTRNSAIMEEKHGKTLYKVSKENKKGRYVVPKGIITPEMVAEWGKTAGKVVIMEDLHGETPVRRA